MVQGRLRCNFAHEFILIYTQMKTTISKSAVKTAAEVCTNLRPDRTGTALVPVGDPATVSSAGGIPIASGPVGGRNIILILRGRELWVADAGSPAAEIMVAEAASDVKCALAVADGFIVMTDVALRLRLDPASGKWTAKECGHASGFPALYAEEAGAVSAEFTAGELSGSYTTADSALSAADTAKLTEAYNDAYSRVCERAAAAGAHVQPVLAAWRLRDHSGNEIYTSAPVLLADPSGIQAAKLAIRASGDGFSTLADTRLTVNTFRVGIKFPAEEAPGWPDEVGTVDLLISPEIHPVSATASAVATFTRSSSDLTVNLTAPGVSTSTDPSARGTLFHSRLMKTLGSFSRRATVCSMPAAASGTTAASASPLPIKKQIAATDSNGTLAPASDMMRAIAAPHSFTAGAAARSGDTIVWADITARRFSGYKARELAVVHNFSGAAAVPTACRVKFSDGTAVVTSLTEHDFYSLKLSPLIVYPHPAATEITVIIGKKSVTLPLSSTPDGDAAYYLSPRVRPIGPDTELPAFVMPAAETPVEAFADGVAAARADEPLKATGAVLTGTGRIAAATPSVRTSSSGWDFARGRFYTFGPGGICAVAVSASRISAAIIDSRGVSGKGRAALTPAGVVAVAGDDLVKISGSLCTDLLPGTGDSLVGWCGRFGEIWLIDPGSGSVRTAGIKGSITGNRTDLTVRALLSAPPGLYLTTEGRGIVNASVENPAAEREIEWRARIECGAPVEVRALSVWIFASSLRGKVTLTADNGAGAAHALPLIGIGAAGEINSPLTARMLAPRRRYLNLTLKAVAGADSRLEKFAIATA